MLDVGLLKGRCPQMDPNARGRIKTDDFERKSGLPPCMDLCAPSQTQHLNERFGVQLAYHILSLVHLD